MQPSSLDPYELIEKVYAGPNRSFFFLPGKPIFWEEEVCHYLRLDRLVEHSLQLPISGSNVLDNVASMIENQSIAGVDLERKTIGRLGRPLWITSGSLKDVPDSDTVRNALGLRSLNQAGHRLAELRYTLDLAKRGTKNAMPIHAPTVLDSWEDGATNSWIFTKALKEVKDACAGFTVDLSITDGGRGVPEAVHDQLHIFQGDGKNISLRVLAPTTGPPPEISLYGLLCNQNI